MAYHYENLKLEKGMYSQSGRSFAQTLEALDPSENYKGTSLEGLDAFQRQLKRFDIKVKGAGSDRVEKFFWSTESAVLFPEFVSRVVRQGMEEESILPDIRLLRALWPDREHAPHAGQFFTLRAWGADEAPFLSRPISVHKWEPETQTIEFLYQVIGEGTHKIAQLKTGDTFQLTGPMGNGFDIPALTEKYHKIAVVGGGIGTAPMYQVTRELAAAGVKPDVFFGFRDTPYCMEEYRSIANVVKVSTDTGAVGFHGFVTQLYDPADYDAVLICGPTVMMKNAARICAEKGTPCFVSLEKKMACGIGACLGCTCETKGGEGKSVCKNGPVFDATEVFF